MSIELILIPVGIAVYAAIKERTVANSEASSEQRDEPVRAASEKLEQGDPGDGGQPSRITDADLLGRALEHAGANNLKWEGPVLTAQLSGRSVRFKHVAGEFIGRIDSGTADESRALVASVDAVAGQIVQAEKVEEMRTRAAQLGLVLVGEELAEDGTVQLVFEEAT